MTAIMGNLSLIIYFIYHEFESKDNAGTRDPQKWPDPMDDPVHKANTNFVRSIVAGLSAVSVYCLIQRHYYKMVWKKDYFASDSGTKLYYRFMEVTADP